MATSTLAAIASGSTVNIAIDTLVAVRNGNTDVLVTLDALNAATATILQTGRTINGVSFNGSANISINPLSGTVTGAMMSGTGAVRTVVLGIDGGGNAISTGTVKASITIPFTGTIAKWYLAADQSGSIVIDIKRSGTTIINAGNKPTLSTAQTGNAAPASWTSTAITKGDIFTFNVDSITSITNINLVLEVTVT